MKEQLSNNENFNFIEELAKQDIDIFDPNSDFYTDLCFHFKSPIDGKDIPVKDRIKLFFPNITLCEEGCNIKGVNATSWKVLCECTLKDLMNSNPFGNNLLVQKSFGEVQDILTNTNIEVMKCYKDIYDFEMYKKNTGMIIVLILILFQLICIIIYYTKSKLKIKKYILSITDKFLSSLSLIRNNSNSTNNNISEFKHIPKSSPPKNNLSDDALSQKGNKKPIIRNVVNNKSKTVVKKNGIMAKNTRLINVYNKSPNKIASCLSKESPQLSKDNFIKIHEKVGFKKKEYEPIIPDFQKNVDINIEEFIKTDPDDMDYDEAIRLDKRTYCEYFWERIKSQIIILSTFLKYEFLKPIPIKIILLILNIDLYLIINGLFFNENYISDLLHKESETAGAFVMRIIDRIITITIAGVIINYIIEFFFVEENKIRKIFKREKENIIVLKYEIIQLIKNTHKKYNIFIIISSVIMLFSLYYIFCFNNVYPCIKSEWLKSSLIIICIMQILLPIVLCFLDTSIRFISFRFKSERLFKLSALII